MIQIDPHKKQLTQNPDTDPPRRGFLAVFKFADGRKLEVAVADAVEAMVVPHQGPTRMDHLGPLGTRIRSGNLSGFLGEPRTWITRRGPEGGRDL